MKKVFVADKSSFGAEFYEQFKTLDELKKGIVAHEYRHTKLHGQKYMPEMYTEELFKKSSRHYKLYEVNLHDDEMIEFHEYDGQSWFSIEKKDPNLLSTKTLISI